MLRRETASVGLRSEGAAKAEVVLVDSIGELASLYALAELVFVGGTLAPIGGHNLIEPVQAGKLVVHGPHVENQRSQGATAPAAGGAAPCRARPRSRSGAQSALGRRDPCGARRPGTGGSRGPSRSARPFAGARASGAGVRCLTICGGPPSRRRAESRSHRCCCSRGRTVWVPGYTERRTIRGCFPGCDWILQSSPSATCVSGAPARRRSSAGWPLSSARRDIASRS